MEMQLWENALERHMMEEREVFNYTLTCHSLIFLPLLIFSSWVSKYVLALAWPFPSLRYFSMAIKVVLHIHMKHTFPLLMTSTVLAVLCDLFTTSIGRKMLNNKSL